MNGFLDFYRRLARLVIGVGLLVGLSLLYFFFYPPLNPKSSFYFITPKIEQIAFKMDFVLRSTAISKTTFTAREDIVKSVFNIHQLTIGEALPLIPARAIKTSLEKLPMIISATVAVHYPSRELRINFVEREPIAVLHNRQKIITRDGSLLAQPTIARLPDNIISLLYKGSDGLMVEKFIGLYNQFQDYSLLLEILHQAEFVGGRRWRLWLRRPLGNGYLIVEMPEEMTPATMGRLSRLVLDDKVLNLKIERVDLRLENQTTVRLLSPDKP